MRTDLRTTQTTASGADAGRTSKPLEKLSSAALVCSMVLLFGLMVLGLGGVHAFLLVISILAFGTVPGAALVRRVFPHASLLYYLVLGTVAGLALWALGGLFSSISGVYVARWVPLLLAAALWFWPRRRLGDVTDRLTKRALPAYGKVGAILAIIALLPSLKTVLTTQPAEWAGWHQFYLDIPFQIALTAEAAARVPESYPWVLDTPLSYPWLYHSAMGMWSSVSTVPAAGIVLQGWPVLFAGLLPVLLAIAAWEVTRNKLASGAAPLVYVLAHGLVVVEGGIMEQVPLLQISPTRDFAHLFVLIAVLCMVFLFQRRSSSSVDPRWWQLLLVLSSFVAAGSKGSPLPILLGGILSAGLALMLARQVRRTDFITLGWFLVAVVTSTLLVLPEPGFASISWGPLTFLAPETPNRPMASILILVLIAAAVIGFCGVIAHDPQGGWTVAALLTGVSVAGLIGLAVFAHPGYSQNYFWQSAQPVFAIAMAWSVILLWRKYSVGFIAAALLVFLLAQVSMTITSRVALVSGAVVVAALIAAATLAAAGSNGGIGRRGLAGIVVLSAVLVSTAQIVSVPVGKPGGTPSAETSKRAIHSTQLGAFDYIRTHSSPEEVVLTNKHCFGGALATNDCVPKWFALAAWSERRVLVEGWGYTHLGDSLEPFRGDLELSSSFINSPTNIDRKALLKRGVSLVYIDKREPFSSELSDMAVLVYESEWANVYSITGDHAVD